MGEPDQSVAHAGGLGEVSGTDLIPVSTRDLLVAPTNATAEWSVLAHMLGEPKLIGEVIGIPLEQKDFSQADTRLLYATTVNRYYANQPVDALIIGELAREELANYWGCEAANVAEVLVRRVEHARITGTVMEHAGIVKRLSTSRKIVEACSHALTKINSNEVSPEEVGDELSGEVLQATAGSIKRSEILDWMSVGREYFIQLERVRAAKEQGIEIGVYTGLPFIDDWTAGIGPGELCFLGGDPGVGKTALAWAAGMGFAARQAQRDEDQRVGTLILSMEMALYNSTARIVSNITGIDGTTLREGAVSERSYRHALREWKNRENLPMYFNFAPNFRLSQMRALIAEAIRRANVGFVVIDHFKMIDTDRKYNNPNQEDDDKVKFLKQNIARDLNVAVMCLAHTVKVGRGMGGESPRPRLSDLRGSGQISAFADFVALAWNPHRYVADDELLSAPSQTERNHELLWVKNRFGSEAAAPYKFDAPRMLVSAPTPVH